MVSDWFKNLKLGNLSPAIATVLCLLAVPVLMANKEWDDHDRSHKTLALATAKNYLNSCEPNAILFTEGDNDTYPLWYAQEVEGIRPDIRMVNISLLGIDWYIDQLKNAVNQSAPVELIWKSEQYRGDKRNYIQYQDTKSIAQDKYVNLTEILNFVGSDESGAQLPSRDGTGMNYFPVKNFFLPVDKALAIKNGMASATDSIVEQVQFSMPKNVAYKNDLAILNILAANAWKRPIYFANSIDPDHYEGLEEYLQLEGLAYKLTPVRTMGNITNSPLRVNAEKCMDLILNKFEYGNAHRTDVNFDQTNRRMLNTPRILALQLADYLIRNNRKEDAKKVINKVINSVSESSYPTAITQEDRSMILMADMSMKAGDKELAKKITDKLVKFCQDDVAYINSLKESLKDSKYQDAQFEFQALGILSQSASANGMPELGKELADKVNMLAQQLPQMPRQ
jgi:hypothetical protein